MSAWKPKDTKGHINKRGDLAGRFCEQPFRHLEIYSGGHVSPCCKSWLLFSVPTRYTEGSTIMDVWNSEPLQDIRESILDGSFRHCNQATCPMIQSGNLPRRENVKDPGLKRIIAENRVVLDEPPRRFSLSYDPSCNLTCPSCRVTKINRTSGPAYEKSMAIQNRFVRDVFSNPSNRRINIRVTGSGDAIGSKIFRRLLTALDGASFPNLSIVLHTNGVLLTPRWWSRFRKIHGNIEKVDISIDAATPDTYAVTRRGGNWEVLQRNIRFLCEQGVHVIAGFVVQQANYREMPAFVRLARSLGASRVKFSLVLDWGTWDKEAYEKHCIWKSYHSEFPAFLETLRAPELADSMILWGNVAAYREYATSRQRTGAGTGVTRQATSFPPPGSTRNNNPRPGTP